MIRVTTEWRQQRTLRGKTSQNLLEAGTEEFEWPDSVAASIAALLERHPRLTFSGMEDFGEGGCVLDPLTLRCKAYGDCRHHHIESVKEWVEQRVGDMKVGETEDFTGGALKWVSVSVEVLPDPDPEPDEDEDEDEEPEEPTTHVPAEVEPPPVPAGVETYIKRSAFSSEVRPIGEPITHAEDSAETLAERGELVRVRPHYKVPDGRSSLTTVRSPWAFEAHVVRVVCGDMVLVRYAWAIEDTPWTSTGAFKVSELHNVHACECAACCGEHGITEFEGA
ncbi:hypothetical protein ABZX93_05975 [Streptomyces sp. NPDC006632]|uniref:hypothetical protein n=1 Tax=Streptomyces sp. NPDC006632 TaxID=3157182 RepID=UPI0033A77729